LNTADCPVIMYIHAESEDQQKDWIKAIKAGRSVVVCYIFTNGLSQKISTVTICLSVLDLSYWA
jgi:hypothetical protein